MPTVALTGTSKRSPDKFHKATGGDFAQCNGAVLNGVKRRRITYQDNLCARCFPEKAKMVFWCSSRPVA